MSIGTADPAVAVAAVAIAAFRLAVIRVMLDLLPSGERIIIKVRFPIRHAVIIAEPRHAVIGTEKREGDCVVHMDLVAG